MKNVQVSDKFFSPYISEEEIIKEVKRVASAINSDLEGKSPVFLVILNGSFIFAADLLREISIPCEIKFMRVASYEGTSSTGNVKEILGLDESIEGRTVVIVEDIIDSGTTMCELLKMLRKRNPADIRIASLLVKPKNLKVELDIDYRCFDIENDFIVGYGLDYNQEGRNLREIYKITD
jgi:hypoxanthine phosphoribosyltransferase